MMALLHKKSSLVIFLLTSLLALNSCKKKKDSDPAPGNTGPTLTLSKAHGVEGMSLEITGGTFGTTVSDIAVTFNGVDATVISTTGTAIQVEVPASSSGAVKVTVKGTTFSSQPVFSYVNMTCADFAKLQYSNFTITSQTSGTINYTVDLKNTGTNPLDLTHATIQNYTSADNKYDNSDNAAGGFSMYIVNGADYILEAGETIHVSHHANNLAGSYLIVELKAYVGNYVDCNDAKQYIVTAK
ncbi:IPT/TIG domain-containing protein [Flavobacterium sp.]|uniref:IPT/TIG domain-containing protein n=1 Tax=Flavobacterium sp. TaxID=239 RepID=UPI0025B88A3B|nr:IPT/TIG domain-containing protein [Flavobacterium sp.]